MKKIFLIFIISIFGLTSCGNENSVKIEPKFYKTATVQSGNILESESFIGYTDSFNRVSLGPKTGGKIIEIYKNIGDRVKNGETVAVLDSSEAKTGYATSTDIIGSLENLKKSTAQMYDSQIAVIQQKIAGAKTGIDIADVGISGNQAGTLDTKNTINAQLKTIDAQILTAQTGLESAKNSLENTQNSLDGKENDIYNNSKNAISQANILAANILNFTDSLFGLTGANKYKNVDIDIYISGRNTDLKIQIKNMFSNLNSQIDILKELPLDSKENIEVALNKYNSVFSNDIRKLLSIEFSAMENSIAGEKFPDSSITNYKNQITTFQNQNEQVILNVSGNYFLGLKGSIDSISSLKKEKKSTLDMMQKQVEIAQKQIDTLQQTKLQIASAGNGQMTDINTKTLLAQKQKDLSKNAFNEVTSSLDALLKQKEASIAQIDTQIQQAQGGKNDASVMIENGKIISLVDGIVTEKFQEVGNVINAGTPILSLASDNMIKITVSVPQEILDTLTIGNNVKVEIEGVNEQKNGFISKIFPSRDEITKKTNVEITLDNQKQDIKLGSYSKVYFNIKNQTHGIIIPNNALIGDYMIPQVYIIEKGKAILKTIQIIKQNDNFSQITGIQEGATIITEGKENIVDGEVLTQ